MSWVVLLCLVACSLAQVTQRTQFSCSFSMSQPSLSPKIATGTIKYDWTNRRYSLGFASGNNELYTFNNLAGYGKSTDQFLFSYSSSCPCVTNPLSVSMPAFAFNASLLSATGVAGQYKPKAAGNQFSTITFDASGYPSAAVSADGRNFKFSACVAASYTIKDWPNPAGCSCGQPQDVVIAWDRSSSITYTLFQEEKAFAKALVAGFQYGPLETALGMVNFHTETWNGPVNLNKGTTLAAATAGADGLACAPSAQCHVYNSPGTCCGSGTCISCGIVAGADMLATQASTSYERRNSAKILIVFSDGGESVLSKKNGEDPIRDAEGMPVGDKTMFSASLVEADLKWAVAYAKRRVPGILIYAVGAGPLFVRSQLQIITEGDDSRIFTSNAWDDILNLVGQLVAKTCGDSSSPCTNCCGSCACSPWCRQSKALGVEVCNDSNNLNGDGCDKSCRIEEGFNCPAAGACNNICGDGKLVGIEKCDDGNKANGDGCSSTCTIETGWRCPNPGKPCTTICGDGLKLGTEACDDGNLVSNDGCSSKCTVETGWNCPTPGKPCSPICGDGKMTGSEACDDGNKVNGDGCTSTCTIEKGFTCPTPGKPCLDVNECSLYGCKDAANPKYPARCVESNTPAARIAINARQCTCQAGFYLAGTDPAKINTTVVLTGNAPFPGCKDLNECTLYKCPEKATTTSCTDSSTSATVALQTRNCRCTAPGWYAKQSTSKPINSWVVLANASAFTGCISQCGDSIIVGAETCDDGNAKDGDGCSSKCAVEPGYVCGKPGLACCVDLPKSLQTHRDRLQCWNSWWAPKQIDEKGNPMTVVLGNDNGDPVEIDEDVKLCGPFNLKGKVIVSDNATVAVAGSLYISDGGNLTFTSPSPYEHGVVNFLDSCGFPQYTVDEAQPQFAMQPGSSLNINGFNWTLSNTTYAPYLNVKYCVDTYHGDLFMAQAEGIPDNSNSFPVISASCLVDVHVGDNDDVPVKDKADFHNLAPKNLPGGCSDLASFRKVNGENGTDLFVQTNKKDLCNAQVYSLITVIPFIGAAALGIGAASAAFALGGRGVGSDDDYVAL